MLIYPSLSRCFWKDTVEAVFDDAARCLLSLSVGAKILKITDSVYLAVQNICPNNPDWTAF